MDLLQSKTAGGHSAALAVLNLPRQERQRHEIGITERYAAAVRGIPEGNRREPSPEHGRRGPTRRVYKVWHCFRRGEKVDGAKKGNTISYLKKQKPFKND